MIRHPPRPRLFPYTTLFRSLRGMPKKFGGSFSSVVVPCLDLSVSVVPVIRNSIVFPTASPALANPAVRTNSSVTTAGYHHGRSEEHTSELQSLTNLVCRLLL